MHACDIVGYGMDGAILCDDCGVEFDKGDYEDGSAFPIFADAESDVIGVTCDSCESCYVIGYGWTDHESACEKKFVRWAVCRECNSHYPYDRDCSDYPDARDLALRHKLICSNCAKPAVHF